VSEETWNQARLIPTSGINGDQEAERRATSALLAVLTAVKEFGRAITQPLGAPAGKVEAFIEVPFTLGDRKLFPDGLIRVSRGKTTWTALVEVKTGSNELKAEQLEAYLDIARQESYDAVLTISNQISPSDGSHPTKVDGRKTRKVGLKHLSWMSVLTEAVMQKEYRGVADPDQAWILGELIRYLEHPRSGALELEDMGATWITARDAVKSGTLRATDKNLNEVTARFDALIQYCCLSLGRNLGKEVTPVLSRKERSDANVRTQALISTLVADGTMSGALHIPGAAADLVVTADLRAGQIHCHVDLEAPKEGRPQTRVNWLLRQLKEAPDGIRLESFHAYARGVGAAELLATVRDNPGALITDTSKELKSFRVALTCPMGTKRNRGRGSFIDSVANAIGTYYGDVLQNLRNWQATAPKMRELATDQVVDEPADENSLNSTALSSQDEPELDSEAEVVLAARRRLTGVTMEDFVLGNGTPRASLN